MMIMMLMVAMVIHDEDDDDDDDTFLKKCDDDILKMFENHWASISDDAQSYPKGDLQIWEKVERSLFGLSSWDAQAPLGLPQPCI